ncbi:ketopantoate reductase family protein [Polaromonas sp.]|uniref:ketopantoate reductase family protein n=1 Tax=Polaromonas sp. TaxID=1869339 RepID=UPI0017D2BAC1|nr:2-dehydropantoate 2-reductase [Polaromonas sp.]NMM08331.1 ketopantoate reductase family protein [Polaromonas sp.]
MNQGKNMQETRAGAHWFARSPVLVWGGGAIGGCVAAFLARAGVPVKLVDIVGEHVDVVRTTGLQIEGRVAQFVQVVQAVTPELLTGTYDCIFLAVKAQHTVQAVQQLAPHLSDDGVVVSLQNGLNEGTIAARVGAQRTVSGFVNFAADYLAPGRIDYGNRGAVKLGELAPGLTPRVESLAALLRDFDADSSAVGDIMRYKWGKLAYGSMLFATALANETMAETFDDATHRPLFVALAREVIGIARAVHVAPYGFDGFEPDAFELNAHTSLAAASLGRMADHYRHSTKQRSGVWRDLAVRKRKTEVDTQIAEIVRVAELRGRTAPVTGHLIDMIREIEAGTRSIDRSNLIALARRVQQSQVQA